MRCARCGETKPVDDFPLDRAKANGRRSYCKQCARELTKEWRSQPGVAERGREYSKQWSKANTEHLREYEREYYKANSAKINEQNRRRRNADPEKARAYYRAQRVKVRVAVFAHYGEACACCGTMEKLTIDHINGDGGRHRKELFGGQKGGAQFYPWLIRNGFPPGYQTLCHPCNRSKGTGPSCRLDHSTKIPRSRYREWAPSRNVYLLKLPGISRPDLLRAWLAERDRGICGICREPVTDTEGPMRPSVDHIIPLSARPDLHVPENLQLTHYKCNQVKHGKIPG